MTFTSSSAEEGKHILSSAVSVELVADVKWTFCHITYLGLSKPHNWKCLNLIWLREF